MGFRIGDIVGEELRPWPCWRKSRWTAPGAAQAQLRSLTKRGLEKDASLIHTYQCPHCGFWHVGHGRKEDSGGV